MVTIISRGDSKLSRYPMIPYDGNEVLTTVLVDDLKGVDEAGSIVASNGQDKDTHIWTPSILAGFREFLPTVHQAVSGSVEDVPHFELDEHDHTRVQVQLQSEILSKLMTIDAGIIGGRLSQGAINSKAHGLNRIYRIGLRNGLFDDRRQTVAKHPVNYVGVEPNGGKDSGLVDYFLPGLAEPKMWRASLMSIKQHLIDLLDQMPLSPCSGSMVRQHEPSQQERAQFPFIGTLESMLSGNLKGIMMYGTAATEDDPSKFTDYDLLVKVDDLPAAYGVLAGLNPFVVDGQVVFDRGRKLKESQDCKHIGINLLPDTDVVLKTMAFNHNPMFYINDARVLMGSWEVAQVPEEARVVHGMSSAYFKLKTLGTAAGHAYWDPHHLATKPALFEYYVKNLRFFMDNLLIAQGDTDHHTKEELHTHLLERGMVVPDFMDGQPPSYTTQAMFSTMVSLYQLEQEYHQISGFPTWIQYEDCAMIDAAVNHPSLREFE